MSFALATSLVFAVASIVTLAVRLLRLNGPARAFPELRPQALNRELPPLTVLVAMKDAEADVEACVRSILEQDYPELRLLVIDDRSEDETPSRLKALGEEFPQVLSALRIDELPARFGGQNHAFARGVEASSGAWICFTDADCRFDTPQALALVMQDALSNEADFISVLPGMETPTWFERLYIPLCSFSFLAGLGAISSNDPTTKDAAAFGPLMMMKRDTYQQMGGHDRVGHLINGDIAFARVAKAEQRAFRLTGQRGIYHTRMYDSPKAAWLGWTRNFYHSIQAPWRLFAELWLVVVCFCLPPVALLHAVFAASVGTAWWSAAFAWSLSTIFSLLALRRIYEAAQAPASAAFSHWPGSCFVAAILGRALFDAVLRRTTLWHGVRYSAPETIPKTRHRAPPS